MAVRVGCDEEPDDDEEELLSLDDPLDAELLLVEEPELEPEDRRPELDGGAAPSRYPLPFTTRPCGRSG